MPTFSAENLTRFAIDMLAAGGAASDEAAVVAENLIAANLRGYDSHGVMRIPQYIKQIEKSEITLNAQFEVLNETPALLTANGNWGFGRVQAGRLVERLVEKAKGSGVAVGTMIRSGHTGRLGEYCEMATAAGMVAMVMVNNHGGVMRVAPPGGKEPRLSTNPLAVGIPHADEPIVIDFCTCVTAEGKVRVMSIAGKKCPDGWLQDSEGRPTNDPADLYGDPPGTILPMGGTQPYKGFGLGLMVEILSGALSGGVCARAEPINQIGNCMFALVLNPAHFGGAEHFRSEVSNLIEFVRGCPRIDGVDQITLPGDPERDILAAKSAEGITLDEGNWSKLVAAAEQRGVALPGTVGGE